MLKNVATFNEFPVSSEKTIDIGFDCDDVLFSCSDFAIEQVNKDYNLELETNKLKRWGYRYGDYKKMYQYFSDENFVRNQPVLDGAVQFMKKLNKVPNVRIYFVTAVPASMMSIRAESLKKNFPFIDEKNFILTSSKNITKFDVFVDDNPMNIFSNKSEYRIVKRQKWNEFITGILSFNTFEELWKIIETILSKKGIHVKEDKISSKAMITALVGPSGGKKHEIVEFLKEAGMKKPTSYTTDSTSSENSHSIKIGEKKFDEMVEKEEIIFPTYYGNNKYGFKKEELEEMIQNEEDIITLVDINSAYALKSKYPTRIIYREGEKEELITDILNSNYSTQEAVNRIIALDNEKDNARLCDFIIPSSDTARKAAQRIINLINENTTIER